MPRPKRQPPAPPAFPAPFDRFAAAKVVVDTTSSHVYVGTLVGADAWGIELEEADCHDRGEGHSTNEKYVMEAAKYGVKVNRRRVYVLREKIVSLARLEDVIQY